MWLEVVVAGSIVLEWPDVGWCGVCVICGCGCSTHLGAINLASSLLVWTVSVYIVVCVRSRQQ